MIYKLIEFIISKKHTRLIFLFLKYRVLKKDDIRSKKLIKYYHFINPRCKSAITFLGDMYKNDRNISAAENYYFLLTIYAFEYGMAKLATLYSDSGLHEKANKVIEEVLTRGIRKEHEIVLPMFLRISPYYKMHKYNILKFRDYYFSNLLASNVDVNIKLLFNMIKCRYIPGIENHKPLIINNFKSLIYDNDVMAKFYNSAYHNDIPKKYFKVIKKGEVSMKEINLVTNDHSIVELFLPSVLFNNDNSKKIYSNIRLVFFNIILDLMNLDIIVLPRMQYNWRYVDSYTFKTVICYHVNRKDVPNISKLITIQESTLPDRVSIDTSGYAGFSSIACRESGLINKHNMTNDQEAVERYITEFKISKRSKYAQNINPTIFQSNYIFFPLQVETDIVTQLRYFKLKDGLFLLINFCIENNLKLILKKHPYCKSLAMVELISQLLEKFPDVVIVKNDSIHHLIKNSNFIVTANSGVGLEALFYNKPVVIFGAADYDSVVFVSKTCEEFKLNLSLAHKAKNIDYTNFISYYINQYTFNIYNSEGINNKIKDLLFDDRRIL